MEAREKITRRREKDRRECEGEGREGKESHNLLSAKAFGK